MSYTALKNIEKAKQLVESVRGKHLSFEDRMSKVIELSGYILEESIAIQSAGEKKRQSELARTIQNPRGKAFLTALTDQSFRSRNDRRVADQLVSLLHEFGDLNFLSFEKRYGLKLFEHGGLLFPGLFVPFAKYMIRRETSHVILPGEPDKLEKAIKGKAEAGVTINLNYLGEAILGEEEAEKRLQIYLDKLKDAEVEYLSVKISGIYSQIDLLAWTETLEVLSERLRLLFRQAIKYPYLKSDGTTAPKFVNLDMEEYKDLQLTLALFIKVLNEPEFKNLSAGIVLQSYIPESYLIQQQLTAWAKRRCAQGGAPIKIRIVKGANLGIEQVQSSIKGWVLPTFNKKIEADANYKKMVEYGCSPENARFVHIGIGSHNIFDIAYAMILRSENQVEPFISFEMLEGMANHIWRVVKSLSGHLVLYCPFATADEFQSAIAYLIRRLDENTAPENFLRQLFGLKVGSAEWIKQVNAFITSCTLQAAQDNEPRRRQNRLSNCTRPSDDSSFENEPDTDWSLEANRRWSEQILIQWSSICIDTIPLVIGGDLIYKSSLPPGTSIDPSNHDTVHFSYIKADKELIERCLQEAQTGRENWNHRSVKDRSIVLSEIAQGFRRKRGDLIGAMVANTAKTIHEADAEVSEAIDFAEYYRRNAEEIACMEDIRWEPKGTALIAPPWNFPCSIAAGGIISALAAGNNVIFKPSCEAVLVGWELANIFWGCGVPQDVLQFIVCDDDPIGSMLIKDPRVSLVILTGATATAKKFLKMRPGIDLIAETGGKNAIIVTGLADRDLAIKSIVQSAFGYSGQKCSACSLAILEAEVYDDPSFRQRLKDAAQSMSVGSAWDFTTRISSLIRSPSPLLQKALTFLDAGEEWLLEPIRDAYNEILWSPGIKLGVKPGSISHQNEFFGPVLSLMRADNLSHAIELANGTPYGLTSGLQSLDQREHTQWIEKIIAGNLYINREITGAIVQRQPFGGCKDSNFGSGAKAGGPNYIMQMMTPQQIGLPKDKEVLPEPMHAIARFLEAKVQEPAQMALWNASAGSYAFFWKYYFSKTHDPSQLLGEDNIFKYVPLEMVVFRVQSNDTLSDAFRVIAAAVICGTPLEVSGPPEIIDGFKGDWLTQAPLVNLITEDTSRFISRVKNGSKKKIRMLSPCPDDEILKELAEAACPPMVCPVMANGRIELLRYLREVSISFDYHRYGYLGEREGEKRKPLPEPSKRRVAEINYNCESYSI
jgi:RHH-type proline utilization regulon transcriptional repressor/proline dehydrogenase/delta 1-pyrroline-5-carboxylate dehydrogenase